VLSVTAAAVVFVTTWGGAAALSWYTLLSSSSWWRTAVVISTPAVRAADERLFLEDARPRLVVDTVLADRRSHGANRHLRDHLPRHCRAL